MMKAPYNAMDVANYIVAEAVKREQPVTHLKLQKLLYYVVAKYTKEHQSNLIDADIVKWQYGPVVKPVYHYFKLYGQKPITSPVPYLISTDIMEPEFADVNVKNAQLSLDRRFKQTVDQVLDTLINLSAFELVERTHKEAAWKNYEYQILHDRQDLSYSSNELMAAGADI